MKTENQSNEPASASGVAISDWLAKLAPNAGIIGIDEKLRVFEGYDGSIECASIETPDYLWDEDDIKIWQREQLTYAEKLCLSELMIERWTKYRDSVANNKDNDQIHP